MDRVFGTYGLPTGASPGWTIQLDHTTYGELTSFFRLPVSLGTVPVASVLGLAVAVVALWRTRERLAQSSQNCLD